MALTRWRRKSCSNCATHTRKCGWNYFIPSRRFTHTGAGNKSHTITGCFRNLTGPSVSVTRLILHLKPTSNELEDWWTEHAIASPIVIGNGAGQPVPSVMRGNRAVTSSISQTEHEVSMKVCWYHSTFRRGRSRTALNVEKSVLFRAIRESPLRSIWFTNTLPDYHLSNSLLVFSRRAYHILPHKPQ